MFILRNPPTRREGAPGSDIIAVLHSTMNPKMITLSRRWTAPKMVMAVALAVVTALTAPPGAEAMFSSSSDVVQAR